MHNMYVHIIHHSLVVHASSGDVEKFCLAGDAERIMIFINQGNSFFMTQGAIFFQLIEFYVSLADDPVQAIKQCSLVLFILLMLVRENLFCMLEKCFLPDANLNGMRLVFARKNAHRLYALDRNKCDVRFLLGGELFFHTLS